MGTKGSVAGAIGGFSEGFGRGFSMMSDVQARRLAERRAERVEAMEREKLDLAKSGAEESSLDKVRLRAEKIAESGISADFEKAPPEQQTAVFDDIDATLAKVIPEETQRRLVTEQIMETTLKKKKDEARALAGDLEAKRSMALGKEKDPVKEFMGELNLMSSRAKDEVNQRRQEMAILGDILKNPDVTPEQRAKAERALTDARLAKADIDALISDLLSAENPVAKMQEIKSGMRRPAPAPEAPKAVPVDIEQAKKIISKSAAGGMSAQELISEIGQEAGYNEAQKQELMEFVRQLERGKTGGKAQADTSYPDTSPGGRQIFPF